jgi:hypothetical protein
VLGRFVLGVGLCRRGQPYPQFFPSSALGGIYALTDLHALASSPCLSVVCVGEASHRRDLQVQPPALESLTPTLRSPRIVPMRTTLSSFTSVRIPNTYYPKGNHVHNHARYARSNYRARSIYHASRHNGASKRKNHSFTR